jgi:hypothetical protein
MRIRVAEPSGRKGDEFSIPAALAADDSPRGGPRASSSIEVREEGRVSEVRGAWTKGISI